MRSTASALAATTAGCCPVEPAVSPSTRVPYSCAIHQPNFLPRLGTLAKLFAADCWIVLDDVQFTRRDYQHRARVAPLGRPDRTRWLSLPTHLPDGRATEIRDARLADPHRTAPRIARTIGHCYGRSSHWQQISHVLDRVLDDLTRSDRTGAVAEGSTRAMLDLLGWRGEIVRSSRLPARRERSQRLADLAAVTGATTYLCGPGGMRYLDHDPFNAAGIAVEPFTTPAEGLWSSSRRLSGLHALALLGATELAGALRAGRG